MLTELTFVVADEQATVEQVLSKYFEFSPIGAKVIGTPPREAFDALAMHLAGRLDELRWQLGFWRNEYRRRFGINACEQSSAMYFLNVSVDTLKRYAYIEESVPYEIRLADKTIWYHDLVASLPLSYQQQCLDYLQETNLKYWPFKTYVQKVKEQLKQVDIKRPPATRADRMMEDDQRVYEAETAAAVAAQRADTLQRALYKWRALTLITLSSQQVCNL